MDLSWDGGDTERGVGGSERDRNREDIRGLDASKETAVQESMKEFVVISRRVGTHFAVNQPEGGSVADFHLCSRRRSMEPSRRVVANHFTSVFFLINSFTRFLT
jgi:hypothetical protein